MLLTAALTLQTLRVVMPTATWQPVQALPFLLQYCTEREITTAIRIAAFLAQLAEESGELHYRREIWGPTPAQAAYEGRADLGNTEPGDGFRYRGRGLIQITGRANYAEAGAALGSDLVSSPELLEDWRFATASAAWFWQSRGCNALADQGDFNGVTRRINGGLTHLDRRFVYYTRAKSALGLT
jgi:putative chitinase